MSATSSILIYWFDNDLVILIGLHNKCRSTLAEHATMSKAQPAIISFCMNHKLSMSHKPVAFNFSNNVLI